MERKEFLKLISVLGLGSLIAPTSLLSSCQSEEIYIYQEFTVNFSGKVIIVGAGSAGLTAGYILQRLGIDYEILEASNVYGGRLKQSTDFSDFPIDLGAEWIHESASVLAKIINDTTVNDTIETINYTPESVYLNSEGGKVKVNLGNNYYGELKFKNTTWFAFFDQYIVPNVKNKIRLNTQVTKIDYGVNGVEITDQDDNSYIADRCVVTVPVTILQQDLITFNPTLPAEKMQAFKDIRMPDGIKVFMEFDTKFYPDIFSYSPDDGEKIYYDAMFRKESGRNILGLFSVGDAAKEFVGFDEETELIDHILKELDDKFDGQASKSYKKHVIQNWSKEPFIQGSYTYNQTDEIFDQIIPSVDNRLFFAGEAYNRERSSTVHGAAFTAYSQLELLLLNDENA